MAAYLLHSLLIPEDQTKKFKGCDGGTPTLHM